jgi:hypothetical protein
MFEEVQIRGEAFQVDKANGIFHVHIREPFFSAGKQFKWLGSTVGLGLSKDALTFALQNNLTTIRVTVGDSNKLYETTTQGWLNFANEANSKMVIGTTEIYVLQWNKTHFKTVGEDKKDADSQ